jgi:hypothetical protein
MASIAFPHKKIIGTLLTVDKVDSSTNPISLPVIHPDVIYAMTDTTQSDGWGANSPAVMPITNGHTTGYRMAFNELKDISSYQFLRFNMVGEIKYFENYTLPYDQGGMTIAFYDSLGNYKEYSFYGGEQYLQGYCNGGNPGVTTVCMDKNSPTFSESVTPIDWSLVAGYEWYIRATTNNDFKKLGVASILAFNDYIATGGTPSKPVGFSDFMTTQVDPEADALSTSIWDYGDWNYSINFITPSEFFDGGVGSLYSAKAPFSIGDGSTHTEFSDIGTSINFYPDAPLRSGRDEKTYMKLSNGDRWMKDTLSPTDIRNLQGSVFSCENNDAWLGFYGTTNDVNSFYKDVGFHHFSKVDLLNNIPFTGCVFNDVDEIKVNADTVVSGSVTSSIATGLLISTVGDYSKLKLNFDSTNTRDITIESGVGIIDLTGISGDNLKIHNTTASDVTITLASGQASTVTTDGGIVTIESPVVFNNASTTGILSGSRLQVRNITSGAEIFNDFVTGDWSLDYGEGTEFTTGDTVRLRACYASGVSYKEPFESFAIVSSSGFSALISQVDWVAINSMNLDGSTVTEFATDFVNIQIDINDPDGLTTKKRLAVWYAYWLWFSATTIDAFFGGMTVEDAANIRVNTAVANLKLDSNSSLPVVFTDTDVRLYTDDGSSVIAATSNTIHMESGKVYVERVSTGNGLSAEQDTQLMGLSKKEAIATKVLDDMSTREF